MYATTVIVGILLQALHVVLVNGDPLVQLPNGQILGREATTLADKTFSAFEGVPYAAPPTGTLRFKAPQPAQNWDGVLDASASFNTMCFQVNADNDFESEDCLYLNVFTPQLPDGTNNVSLPVLLFIYGGAFIQGYNQPYQPDLFMNNDVILVTITYRVGIFGFLSTQDEIVPGNAGLKDQKLAIQWTYDNIRLFGGDSNKITIMGESAGSASVGYQLLNQDNQGLFQGAIMQSGSCLAPFALQRNARQNAFATASLLNPDFQTNNDSQTLLDFLQTVDPRDIDAVAAEYYYSQNVPEHLSLFQGVSWAPVIEAEDPGSFLTGKMYGLLENGSFNTVPLLIGINSEESLSLMPTDSDTLTVLMLYFDANLAWLVPNDMRISDETNRTEMGREIRKLYTGGSPFIENLGHAIRYASDNALGRSAIKHAELASTFANIYFYQFSYDGPLGGANYTHYDGADNVSHTEELHYLFCSDIYCDISAYPEMDKITRERLLKLWTNFATYQNPTPEPSDLLQNVTWPALDTLEGDFYYLDINENLEVRNHPKEEMYRGWTQFYDSLGYSDFDTY